MKLLSLSNIIEWQMSQKRGVTDVLVPALQNILVISARGFHKYSIEPGNTFYIPPSPKSESSGFIFQSNFRRLIQRPPRRFLVFRPLDWYHLKNEISPGRPPINLHPEGANNLWWVLAHSYFHIPYFLLSNKICWIIYLMTTSNFAQTNLCRFHILGTLRRWPQSSRRDCQVLNLAGNQIVSFVIENLSSKCSDIL